MGKGKATESGAMAETPMVSRETKLEALKLRASELKWDPEHLREFLADLVDMI
jgi:hypothetical protein